jgi:hypothetical protein
MYSSQQHGKSNIYPRPARIHHHWWRYNWNFFSDKIELTRVHQTLKQMLFPEINPSDWEMIFSEFNQKMTITPIKRTLENTTCFFSMIGEMALLKQYLITQKITNVNKTPEGKHLMFSENTSKKAFNTKYGTKTKKIEISKQI